VTRNDIIKILSQNRDKLAELKVKALGIYGSVARGDEEPDSDVDILVTFGEDAHWSLYDWMDMIEELKIIFGREVHLFSQKGLRNPFRRHKILTTREVVYGT